MTRTTSNAKVEREYAATPFRLGHCRQLMAEILRTPSVPADQQIARFFANRRYLGSHDRGFIAESSYAVLRGIIRLRWILGSSALRPDWEASLLIAASLVERHEPFDQRALAEALDIRPDQFQDLRERMHQAPERIAELDEPERTALRCSVPAWFAARVMEQSGAEFGAALLESLGHQAPIVLRANTLRTDRDTLAAALSGRGIRSAPGRFAPDALLLERRMNANSIPEFKSGWFEMQDEGSQMLSVMLDPHPNWNVFDACAGAGGKTLHMAAIMRGRGAVVAHDTHTRRLEELRPRMRRSGAQNVRMMAHDRYQSDRDALAGTFNAVMIDAPCTGAGVFRRNPGSWLTFNEGMVERLCAEQAGILREYSGLVKPGGLLLYATCSLLREENELQVERFTAANPGWSVERAPLPETMTTAEGYLRCYPHIHGTDGFFGALLRKI
ncbi:MAG: RsmB/NOP family class I SAM-dependent RNA methyltransferase [Bacteroidetes bacterium]|nr:RsmB/NOP family class I SAM-dependent RNA methyltransferase [Bacteroidota bacterium]